MKINTWLYHSRYIIWYIPLIALVGFNIENYSFVPIFITFINFLNFFDFGYLTLNHNQSRKTFSRFAVIYSISFSGVTMLLIYLIMLFKYQKFGQNSIITSHQLLLVFLIGLYVAYGIVYAFSVHTVNSNSNYKIRIPLTAILIVVTGISFINLFSKSFQQNYIYLTVTVLLLAYVLQLIMLNILVRKIDINKSNRLKRR